MLDIVTLTGSFLSSFNVFCAELLLTSPELKIRYFLEEVRELQEC